MTCNSIILFGIFSLTVFFCSNNNLYSQNGRVEIRFVLKLDDITITGIERPKYLAKPIKEKIEDKLRDKKCPGHVEYYEEEYLLEMANQRARTLNRKAAEPIYNYKIKLTIDIDGFRAKLKLIVINIEVGDQVGVGENSWEGVSELMVSNYANIDSFIGPAFDQAFSNENFRLWLKDYKGVYASCYEKANSNTVKDTNVIKIEDKTTNINTLNSRKIIEDIKEKEETIRKEPSPFPWKAVGYSSGGVAIIGSGIMIGRSVNLYQSYKDNINPFDPIYLDPGFEGYLGNYADPGATAIETREAVRTEAQKWGYLSLIPLVVGGGVLYLSFTDKWPIKSDKISVRPLSSQTESFGLVPGLPRYQYGVSIFFR
ncbi:MAG: hypothetical protein MRZ79_01625 [Bacteroidia bacterium]|nr:hypothetical protein [Bacteroidia bacterium]